MFPLMLTVLDRDSSTPYYNPLLRAVSTRGNMPSSGFHGLGFRVRV